MHFDKDIINTYIQLRAIDQQTQENQKRLQAGYKVFLSYSTVDQDITKKVSRVLSELEISHFFDRKDINWGQDITKGVAEGLKACTHLLVVISPASLKSSWVAYEIGQAAALEKTILPYLTHPSLDVPDFIKGFHYKTRLREIKEYFQNPSINRDDVKEVFDGIFSRLPSNLLEYSYCAEESVEGTEVWRSKTAYEFSNLARDGYGRIVIKGIEAPHSVEIERYRGWLYDQHWLHYNKQENVIEGHDKTTNLEPFEVRQWYNPVRCVASMAFWEEMVKMLREHLVTKTSDRGGNTT